MRQSHLVWLHMRDDDAQDGHALQLCIKNLLPLRAAFRCIDAAVHHRPAWYAVYLAMQQL